jgi:hypothetical protein
MKVIQSTSVLQKSGRVSSGERLKKMALEMLGWKAGDELNKEMRIEPEKRRLTIILEPKP